MSTNNLCFKQNKKNNVYPYKPQFCCIKVGFKGVTCKFTRSDVKAFSLLVSILQFYARVTKASIRLSGCAA